MATKKQAETEKLEKAFNSKAIMALTEFAVSRGYSLKRVKLANSAAKNHDDASVVGYGGWYLFDG